MGPLMEARELRKSFGRREVLMGVSFSVMPGTLVGIAGENGSGKTTLLRILAGELRPDSGDVFRQGALGYCPQTAVLNETLTVDQHLDFFRAAYNTGNPQSGDEFLEMLGYERYRGERVHSLSGGTKQKLNLTLALMHRPKLLLLDEPYQGFDWETYLRFWDLVSALRGQGCAILIISHLFFEQTRFDVLYRLQDGRLRIRGTTDTPSEKSFAGKEP